MKRSLRLLIATAALFVMATLSDNGILLGKPFSLLSEAQAAPKKSSKKTPARSTRKPARETAAPAKKNLPAKRAPARAPKALAARGSSSVSAQLNRAPTYLKVIRAVDASQPGLEFRTHGLSVDNYFLIVPLQFLSQAWLLNPRSRLYVDVSNQESVEEIELVSLDLAANVALLKTTSAMAPSMPRAHLRSQQLKSGETLVGIAGEEKVPSKVSFLQALTSGPTLLYRVALSGQKENEGSLHSHYLFDRNGLFVGLAGSPTQSGDVWAASSYAIWTLLGRAVSHQPASVGTASAETGLRERQQQLVNLQNAWTQSLLPAQSPDQDVISLQELDCKPHLLNLREKEVTSHIRLATMRKCHTKTPVYLSGHYAAGVEVAIGEVEMSGSKRESEISGAQIAQSLGADAFKAHEQNSFIVNFMTPTECQTQTVSSKSGKKVEVRYCTAALKNESGLNDTVISVATSHTANRSQFTVMRLKGFNQANTKRIMASIIENPGGLK